MQGMHKERQDICKLFNLDRSRFTKTMTCLALNAYQGRRIATLAGLQASRKFEGMTGYDSVVMVGSND